jgi:hypothetical protein
MTDYACLSVICPYVMSVLVPYLGTTGKGGKTIKCLSLHFHLLPLFWLDVTKRACSAGWFSLV